MYVILEAVCAVHEIDSSSEPRRDLVAAKVNVHDI